MNSRIREPLIWPPNRNETSKLTSSDFSASPSVAWTLRMARPMRCAAWNMVGAFIRVSSSPVCGIFQPFGQGRQHRLADREIAGAGDRHDALARLAEDVQLAEGRDVVEAGIGAGVGDHHQTVPHQNSAAIGHSRIPTRHDRAEFLANFGGRLQPQSRAYGTRRAAGIVLQLDDRHGCDCNCDCPDRPACSTLTATDRVSMPPP